METERTDCERYGHSWVGGMMVVHSEDAESVNAERLAQGLEPLECDDCGEAYESDSTF